MREPFRKASVYLSILMWLEVCLGIAIILFTGIFHRILAAYMSEMGCKMLTGQFFNTYILGFQLIVTYLCSIGMWKQVWSRRFTQNVRTLLKMWMFFCFLIVICGFGTIWALFTCADAIVGSAEMSLLKGIDLYYTCPEWKLLWDGLQYHKECCGVNGYEDWMRAAWMPDDQQQNDTSETCPNEQKYTMAPYACCKHSCSSCYENYIPRSQPNSIPSLSLSQINTNGCLPMFSDNLWKVLYVLLVLVIIAFKVDICVCLLTKYIIGKEDVMSCGAENMGATDDEGHPLIVVKCPPNMRCVTIQDDDGDFDDRCEGGEDAIDSYCGSEVQRSYAVKQEVKRVPSTHSTRPCEYQRMSETRILH